jgi:GNAT superfamily N-acetyltransferase
MVARPAIVRPQSAEQIVGAYYLFLQSVAEWSEMLPTKRNAERMSELLLVPAWERGEPIYLAALDGKIVGATFTTLPDPGLDYRVPFASGHGTWVSASWRGHGIAKALLHRVREDLRKLGIKRQVGLVHDGNQASRATFMKLGFTPSALVISCDL